MSLFTFKDICSFDFNEPNCFNSQSAVLVNIDNDPDGQPKVVVGSYTGLLRVFGVIVPSNNGSRPPEEGEFEEEGGGGGAKTKGLKRGILLAEVKLPSGIFQVEAGRFVSGSDKIHLAVLHAKRLSVYSVVKVQGQVEHGAQYKITLLFEHPLKRHAFNFCFGAFGCGINQGVDEVGKRLRHFFCVQSLDGTLSFYEQEVYTFSRYISGTLIPGPIAYIPPLDSFITANSQRLHCFKYSALATAGGLTGVDENYKQTEETSLGVRVNPEWSFSLGEDGIDIQVILQNTAMTASSYPVRLLVATTRNLFCFKSDGELLWFKKFEFNLSSIHSFLHGPDNELISLAASVSDPSAIYVYNQTTLKWAAKLNCPSTAVFLSRIFLQDFDGLIAVLSANGHLSIGYFGTEPSLFVAPPIQARDMDYIAAEKELQELRKIIAQGEQDVLASKDANIEMDFEFEGVRSKWLEEREQELIVLVGTVKLQCHMRSNDARLTIITPKPVVCFQETIYVGDIVGKQNYSVEFFLDSGSIPSDLWIQLFAYYSNETGAPCIVQKEGIKIPLSFIAKPNPVLERDADLRLTFAVNKPVLYLESIYNDFQWSHDSSSTGLTFRLHNGDRVTILASTKVKSTSSSRYRIQSSSLCGIYLIFQDFIARIRVKYTREKSDLRINLLGEEFPLMAEFFDEIDAHILRRTREIKIKEELELRAQQFRAVQRRLLLRFRDKNPVALSQQESLLEGSLDQINDALNFMAQNQFDIERSESKLSGSIRLMLELAVIHSGKETVEELDLLSGAMNPDLFDFVEDKGWEENTLSALTFLKTGISSNSSTNISNFDSAKLKKSIKVALEKIRKSLDKFATSADDAKKTPVLEEPEQLIGNEIIERMARARTAKKQKPRILPSIPEPQGREDEGENEPKPSTSKTLQKEPSNFSRSSLEETPSRTQSYDSVDEDVSKGSEVASNVKIAANGPVGKSGDLSTQSSFNDDDNFWE